MSDGKYIYTEKEVRMMWQRSKPEQIQVAQAKCLEAIVRTGGQLAVSFSGGKDSAVLELFLPHYALQLLLSLSYKFSSIFITKGTIRFDTYSPRFTTLFNF